MEGDPGTSGGVEPDGTTAVVGSTGPEGSTTTGGSTTEATGPETEAGTSGTSTGVEETGSDSSSGGVELLDCVESLVDPPLGAQLVSVDTQALRDNFEGSCGGGNSKDAAFQWIAPFTDYFVFDTSGSEFDTSLYLLDSCDGDELACSDNAMGGVSSRIVGRFEIGQQIVVVLDGETGADGLAVLNVNPVACPGADLEDEPLPGMFTNVGGTNGFSSDCGGSGGLERTFRYTAVEAGLHSFRARSTDFQPIMNLQVGPECGGEDLQCSISDVGQVGGEVIRNLEVGQSVTLIVDSAGGTGEFELDVERLEATCPSGPLAGAASGTITDFPHAMTTSCGNIGETSGGMEQLFSAASYAWTSPGQAGTNSGCEIRVTSGFPAAVSLQAGSTCSGSELQCATSVYDSSIDRYVSSVGVGHIDPTDFTVTVTQTAELLTAILDYEFEIEVACFATG